MTVGQSPDRPFRTNYGPIGVPEEVKERARALAASAETAVAEEVVVVPTEDIATLETGGSNAA